MLQGCAFDFSIFDEAHRTAGVRDRQFSFGLSDDNILCRRRLFMTATPKHAEMSDDGDMTEVYSMDDESVYGPVIHRLSLREAIERGIICDYRIIIAVIKSGREPENRDMAVRTAIDHAMKRHHAHKIFTFHRRISDAQSFIKGATETLTKSVRLHINGAQSSSERTEILQAFDDAESAIISNAKCLTEGVDIPDADMIALLSHKRSVVDIVQAVGRILRKHKNTPRGYIFLPIFLREGEDPKSAISRSDFDRVYDLLQAMREQDSLLADVLLRSDPRKGRDAELDNHILIEGEIDSGDMRDVVRSKMLRPFCTTPAKKFKDQLLDLAKSEKEKPAWNSELGKRLKLYTSKSSRAYDFEFCQELKKAAPSWLVKTSDKKKERLLRLARDGRPRPKSKTALEKALVSYTWKKGPCFDPNFLQEISRLAPEWFKNSLPNQRRKLAKARAELLLMARNGAKKPGFLTPLGGMLVRLLKKDKAFGRELYSLAPSWRPKAKMDSSKNKAVLLRLAKKGGPKPKQTTSLGVALKGYITSSSDREFLSEIRKLSPHWLS